MELLNVHPGQEETLRALAEPLRRAQAGEAGLVLIAGDAQSGKSTLLGVFARSVWKQHRIRALLLRFDPGSGSDPVEQAAGELQGRVSSAIARGLRQGDAKQELYVDWLGAIPVVGNLLAAVFVTLTRVLRGQPARGRAGAAAIIHNASLHKAVVILVDDVHHVDPRAQGRLRDLMHDAPRGCRLLVVTTHRPSRGSASAIDSVIQSLPVRMTTVLHLGAAAVPPTAAAAYEKLPAATQQLLALAATLGNTFDGMTLALKANVSELEVEDALAVAVQHGILAIDGEVVHESGEDATAYRFMQ